ncbi:23535_t:CDS:2 [Gigaspora margarita]|uniref:23535_t:CDS:1 n=1 Tax=Gigaspora margarita TaxID=4874 RepID=A0ABM8W6Q3_GIGMA|nr:23535_t:CDS:2 [Gigaspora margarita]
MKLVKLKEKVVECCLNHAEDGLQLDNLTLVDPMAKIKRVLNMAIKVGRKRLIDF